MPQLTKQVNAFHRLGLIPKEGDFLFLEESSARLFTLNDGAVISTTDDSFDPIDPRNLSVSYYEEVSSIASAIKKSLNHSLNANETLEISPKEIPQELYAALEKELGEILIFVEGFNLAPSPKDTEIFSECILGVENTFLYFLSILYSTSFDLNKKLEFNEAGEDEKRFAMEINRYLESRGSHMREATVDVFRHLDSTFVKIHFSFARGGFIVPFSLMLSLDEIPHPFKGHLNALSDTLLKASKDGLFNDVSHLKGFLNDFFEEKGLAYEVHLRCLSTSFDLVRLLQKEGQFNEENIFYLQIIFYEPKLPDEQFFWSNVFVIKNGLLVPQYRTNEVFLEIEV